MAARASCFAATQEQLKRYISLESQTSFAAQFDPETREQVSHLPHSNFKLLNPIQRLSAIWHEDLFHDALEPGELEVASTLSASSGTLSDRSASSSLPASPSHRSPTGAARGNEVQVLQSGTSAELRKLEMVLMHGTDEEVQAQKALPSRAPAGSRTLNRMPTPMPTNRNATVESRSALERNSVVQHKRTVELKPAVERKPTVAHKPAIELLPAVKGKSAVGTKPAVELNPAVERKPRSPAPPPKTKSSSYARDIPRDYSPDIICHTIAEEGELDLMLVRLELELERLNNAEIEEKPSTSSEFCRKLFSSFPCFKRSEVQEEPLELQWER